MLTSNLVEDSSLLRATINAQRQHSISFSLNLKTKMARADGEGEAAQTAGEGKEEKRERSNNEPTEPNAQERPMLLRYLTAWSDLSTAYQQEGYFMESLESLECAGVIYEQLLMYPHMSLSLGQFALARVPTPLTP